MKIAQLDHISPDNPKALQDLVHKYESCEMIKNVPYRFRLSMVTGEVRFNQRIYMDIMNLDGNPVRHLINEATLFSAVRFLQKISTNLPSKQSLTAGHVYRQTSRTSLSLILAPNFA